MKKFISALLLLVASVVLFQPTAHALPILSQDIFAIEDNNKTLIGSFSLNVIDSQPWFDNQFLSENWVTLTLFGTSYSKQLNDYFAAQFFIDNLAKGVFYLSFTVFNDITEVDYDLFYDMDIAEQGYMTIFSAGSFERDFAVVLGDARVQVPAPTTLAMLIFGVCGLLFSRRARFTKRY